MRDTLIQRRRWFDVLGASGEQEYRVSCPCCGYLTLTERNGYDICYLCDWEDDGQDDQTAAEVWGGPNGWLSLEEARQHFERFRVTMSYSNETDLKTRHAIVGAFDAMLIASPEERLRLWQEVITLENILLKKTPIPEPAVYPRRRKREKQ